MGLVGNLAIAPPLWAPPCGANNNNNKSLKYWNKQWSKIWRWIISTQFWRLTPWCEGQWRVLRLRGDNYFLLEAKILFLFQNPKYLLSCRTLFSIFKEYTRANILNFIFDNNSKTKRATRDLLVSKRPNFLCSVRCS